MREVRERLENDTAADGVAVTLNFDRRRKSRQRIILETGEEVALVLPRGTVLKDGDRLRADDGGIILVKAAPEPLSSVETPDPLLLARAAYHLGNRHVALQILPGCVRYQHDHVLDDMVRTLGLGVQVIRAPFQPEPGAYGGGHRHGHDDDHHGHTHGDGAA